MNSWLLLSSGDFIGAIISVYTNVVGNWFFAIILFALLGMVYIRTNNIGITGILTVVTVVSLSAMNADLLPTLVINLVYGLIVLVMTIALFRLFVQK
jgi:hypothetical protein